MSFELFVALRYLLAYPRVRIYVGSWNEWAEDESLPVAEGRTAEPGSGTPTTNR